MRQSFRSRARGRCSCAAWGGRGLRRRTTQALISSALGISTSSMGSTARRSFRVAARARPRTARSAPSAVAPRARAWPPAASRETSCPSISASLTARAGLHPGRLPRAAPPRSREAWRCAARRRSACSRRRWALRRPRASGCAGTAPPGRRRPPPGPTHMARDRMTAATPRRVRRSRPPAPPGRRRPAFSCSSRRTTARVGARLRSRTLTTARSSTPSAAPRWLLPGGGGGPVANSDPDTSTNGQAVALQGTSITELPEGFDPVELTAVSCPDSDVCIAADSAGRVLTYTRSTGQWSMPVPAVVDNGDVAERPRRRRPEDSRAQLLQRQLLCRGDRHVRDLRGQRRVGRPGLHRLQHQRLLPVTGGMLRGSHLINLGWQRWSRNL